MRRRLAVAWLGLAASTCAPRPPATIAEALAGFPRPPPEEPRSDDERLIAASLEAVVRESDVHFRAQEVLPIARRPGMTAAIIPKALAGRFVLVEPQELHALARRFGSVPVIVTTVKHPSPTQASVRLTVTLWLAPEDQSEVMCCGGRDTFFERRGDRWVQTDWADFDI